MYCTLRCKWIRTKREFDNKFKILDEIIYNEEVIVSENTVDTFLFPLYGSLALGLYYKAFKKLLGSGEQVKNQQTQFIRVGFHDLSNLSFITDKGCVLWGKIVPKPFVEELIYSIRNKKVYIIDDNIGYGKTFQFCSDIVKREKGIGYTRSAETAWHLFIKGDKEHDISDAVDYPQFTV